MPVTTTSLADVDCDDVPTRIRRKAYRYLNWLADGLDWHRPPVRGYRMSAAPNVVVLPISRKWRMTGVLTDDGFEPRRIVSHERYNKIEPSRLV